MRPRIAINCDVEARGPEGQFRRDRLALYTAYLDAIYAAGGEPVILPADLRALPTLSSVDGILLTGGDDYVSSIADPATPPERYTAMHPRREEFDTALVAAATELDLPLLAICAGFQLVVIHGGGKIYGDIEEEIGGEISHRRTSMDDPYPRHVIDWSGPAPKGLSERTGCVMSHHHQGVASLPADWRVWGSATDGVIEGAIGPGEWQVAVQWHPELAAEDGDDRALFCALIDAATIRASKSVG